MIIINSKYAKCYGKYNSVYDSQWFSKALQQTKNKRENTKVYLSQYIKNVNHIIEAIKILNFEGWKKTLGLSEVILIMIKIRGRLNIHQYIVQNGSICQVIQMKLILKTLKRKKATIN